MNYEARLKKRVDDQARELQAERLSKDTRKRREKAERAYDKLPAQSLMDFWCDRCQEDIKAPAFKNWSSLYGAGSWLSFCINCRGVLVRYINNKTKDPYYDRSRKIAVMRGEFHNDMLQPDQHGFRTMYGDPHQNWIKEREGKEEAIRAKYASYGLRGTSLAQKSEQDEIKEMFEL